MSRRNHGHLSKLGLTAGFLALLGAVLLARQSPPTGYELSIYRATPTEVWLLLAVALVAGVGAALAGGGSRRTTEAGLLLASAAVYVVVTLPVLRGYYFYGAGDSLSHLGWTRELATGSLSPLNLLYPAIHTTALFFSAVTGASLRMALMLVVLGGYTLVFLLFVPLCVRLFDSSRLALTLGVLSALLFAPINGLSVHPTAHPTSQAILFVPFVLYLVFRYVTRPKWASTTTTARRPTVGERVSSVGILLALASTAVVLIHPQQALNVALFFAAIAGVQLFYRHRAGDHPIATHRPLYAQTALIGVVFFLWAPRFQRVQGATVAILSSLLEFGATAGTAVITAKASSLVAIGGSLLVIFLKLFLPALVLSLFAGGLAIALVRGWVTDERTNTTSLLVYLVAGLVPLFGVFLMFFVSSAGDQYFRYQGFIMVPVTVLGTVALARVAHSFERQNSQTAVRAGLAVLFLVLVPIGAAAFHASPYIYQPTPHVPESQAEGYAAAFEYREMGTPFVGIRGGPRRYVDAIYGTEFARSSLGFPGYRAGIGRGVFERANYTDAFEEDHYLVITESTYEMEVVLYDGFRYDAESFRALETTPGVNRVMANDEFRLYRIDEAE